MSIIHETIEELNHHQEKAGKIIVNRIEILHEKR